MRRSIVVCAVSVLALRYRAHQFLRPPPNSRDQVSCIFSRDEFNIHIVIAEGDGEGIEATQLIVRDRQHNILAGKQARQINQIVRALKFNLARK